MTVLAWHQLGERRYETGIDRGVLYLPNGSAVPWNGLVSISESKARDIKSYYLDGIKYLDYQVPSEYSAKLGAYTYPDELDEILGDTSYLPGLVLHDQSAQMFHLSYRTQEGNDVDGIDAGYKIHIVWNITASPSDVAFGTIGQDPTPGLFEWNLTGTPSKMFGIRPTSHISLHSRHIDPTLLADLEGHLYGTEETNASLPNLVDFFALVASP
jgi:hypothetical protein